MLLFVPECSLLLVLYTYDVSYAIVNVLGSYLLLAYVILMWLDVDI